MDARGIGRYRRVRPNDFIRGRDQLRRFAHGAAGCRRSRLDSVDEWATSDTLCRRRIADRRRCGTKAHQHDFFHWGGRFPVVCGAPAGGAGIFCGRWRHWSARHRRCVVLDAVAGVRKPGVSILQHGVSFSGSSGRGDRRFAVHAAWSMGRRRLSVLLAGRQSPLIRMGISGSAFRYIVRRACRECGRKPAFQDKDFHPPGSAIPAVFPGRLWNVAVCIFNSSLCGGAGIACRAADRPTDFPFAARAQACVVQDRSAAMD